MLQTEGQMTSKHSVLEVSVDGVNYVDISCSSNSFEPSGGGHMTGSSHVFCEDIPLIGIGKREPLEATVRIIYTEVDSEATDLIDGFFENQTRVYLRWRPAGTASGNWEWTTRGYFTGPVVPPGDATSADILTVEIPWFGAAITMGPQAS